MPPRCLSRRSPILPIVPPWHRYTTRCGILVQLCSCYVLYCTSWWININWNRTVLRGQHLGVSKFQIHGPGGYRLSYRDFRLLLKYALSVSHRSHRDGLWVEAVNNKPYEHWLIITPMEMSESEFFTPIKWNSSTWTLRNDPLVQYEFEEIKAAIAEEKLQNMTGWLDLVRTPGNRKRMRIVIAIAFFSQWSGNGLV